MKSASVAEDIIFNLAIISPAKAMSSVKDIAADAADAIIEQVTGKKVAPDVIKTALAKFA